MKVYQLMAALSGQKADADVVFHGSGLLSSDIIKCDVEEAGPDMVHITIEPQLDDED